MPEKMKALKITTNTNIPKNFKDYGALVIAIQSAINDYDYLPCRMEVVSCCVEDK